MPDDPAQLQAALDVEHQGIKQALEAAWTSFDFKPLYVAPTRTRPCMLIYADGTQFNPGSGEGVYRRNIANTAWLYLG